MANTKQDEWCIGEVYLCCVMAILIFIMIFFATVSYFEIESPSNCNHKTTHTHDNSHKH